MGVLTERAAKDRKGASGGKVFAKAGRKSKPLLTHWRGARVVYINIPPVRLTAAPGGRTGEATTQLANC